jgi:hypothetical protein
MGGVGSGSRGRYCSKMNSLVGVLFFQIFREGVCVMMKVGITAIGEKGA